MQMALKKVIFINRLRMTFSTNCPSYIFTKRLKNDSNKIARKRRLPLNLIKKMASYANFIKTKMQLAVVHNFSGLNLLAIPSIDTMLKLVGLINLRILNMASEKSYLEYPLSQLPPYPN